jgi:hypothetical protein
MRHYPDTHIDIVGCNSMQPEIGEVIEVSKRRGEVVRGYLSEIWGIDTSRLGLLAPRGFPPKDPLGVVENPRVEIVTNDWRIIHPIITYDTTNYLELVDSVSNHYYLILFESNDLEMGPIHKRIMEEYVMTKLCKPARVTVNGFNDLGFDSSFVHNFFIGARVNNVTKYIKSEAQTGVIYRLSTQIVSKTAPLYANDLPEGRFYNRCVEIVVVSPAQ